MRPKSFSAFKKTCILRSDQNLAAILFFCRFANDTIEIGCLYPGLAFKHRTVDSYGETSKWGPCVTGQTLSPGVLGHEFVTSDGERTSRVIKYKEKTKADDEEWWGWPRCRQARWKRRAAVAFTLWGHRRLTFVASQRSHRACSFPSVLYIRVRLAAITHRLRSGR